ncbi:hypothetical protein AAG906_008515 [Vitis piasezkii]
MARATCLGTPSTTMEWVITVSWHERWHATHAVPRVWHHGIEVMARIMAWVTCPSTTSSTMSRVIVLSCPEVTRVTCLGSAHGHQARPRGTGRVSWVGSRALCKARGTRHGTAVARVACLSSTRGHQARPVARIMAGGGTRPRVLAHSWAPCKAPWHAS